MRNLSEPRIGQRTASMTRIGVERMGDLADRMQDSSLLRLENLDTDLEPAISALELTSNQVWEDGANSYLPFFGQDRLRKAATALVERNGKLSPGHYDWQRQCFVSAGGLSGILNALLALIEPGDEVVLTSPIYVGLVNRVKLAGGVPRFIRLVTTTEGWRVDLDSLRAAVSARTRAFLMMSPSMPTGAVFNDREWAAICGACIAANAWMIYDAAMERIVFHGSPRLHPLHYPGMAERTVTVGSASKEYRLIGWRVGWIVCPLSAAEAIGRVAISNVVCPVGIAQQAVAKAIESDDPGIARCTEIWQARHDWIVASLASDFRVAPADGGWSLLIEFSREATSAQEASRKLLAQGVSATSMENWGLDDAAAYLRIVFANEPIERLHDIAARFRRALDAG
jgi:N-succinyldiaminopimelate aminotransferase